MSHCDEILRPSCEADNYPDIICETDPYLMTYCYPGNKIFDKLPTLPIDRIPLDSKVIYLNLPQNIHQWRIDDHTMFHRFENLEELRLDGPVHFSNMYEDQAMKSKLINELFKLPNLTILALDQWKLNDSYSWKFPNNLQSVHLTKCDYKQFDLTSYPNLIQINFKWNKLKKMPQLSSPPPPLEVLILSNNPGIEFSAYDIVGLCQLQKFSINTFNAGFDQTRKYCECKRLEKYLAEFRISLYDIFRCNKLNADCKDYSLEEVKIKHAEKCPKSSKYYQNRDFKKKKSWLRQNFIFIIVGSIIAIVALIFCALSIILLLQD